MKILCLCEFAPKYSAAPPPSEKCFGVQGKIISFYIVCAKILPPPPPRVWVQGKSYFFSKALSHQNHMFFFQVNK